MDSDAVASMWISLPPQWPVMTFKI